MSNLNGIPSADYFETRLANLWSGINGVVHVEKVPEWTLPAGEYSYIVVNPGESNMQVAKVDSRDSDNNTFNVSDVWVSAGVWVLYDVKPHPTWAIVRFSNNYAFRKDIQEAVNSKADDSSISAVWKSNSYNDLDNLPAFGAVATSNDYNDLDNKPTPISIAVWDNVLELNQSNELSATISANYDSGTQKITLYGANSTVISEIDCTDFIKDWMIQNVQIVTDPAWYAPWKYLEFDFNTDSGTQDIYIALSDLAVYVAGEWMDITNNTISIVPATANTLWGIKVWNRLTIVNGVLSADSQTENDYTTAEKQKLAGIEDSADVNVIEKVQVNGADLPISAKTVNVQIKTLNGENIAGVGDLDIMARHYTEWTWITIDQNDEISISSAYQTAIANKADSSSLSAVATSGNYTDLSNKPTIPTKTSDLSNDSGFITSSYHDSSKQDTLTAGSNVQISGNTISATGDMAYNDFNFTTLTWSSITLDLSSKITPSANFTVNAPTSIKDGQNYILRVTNWATPYTMTLWTGITNPSSVSLDLTASATDMFVFLAVWWMLELQTNTPDLSWYQTTANMVTTLTWADNDHYPTAKAVSDALSSSGNGDMLKSTYDPNNVEWNAFSMDNMIDGTNNHYISTAQQTVLNNTSGTNTWDQTASDFDIKDLTDSTNLKSTWNGKQDTLTAWNLIGLTSNVVKNQALFVIKESDVTVATDATKGVSPYNTSYGYTDITINNSDVEWVEWALYTFIVDTTMVVTSAYRNVRVRIGTGSYIPVMSANTILAWNSYFTKTNIRYFQYTTKYQGGWALHLISDSNTTYSAMTATEITAGTWTTARLITPANLKTAIETRNSVTSVNGNTGAVTVTVPTKVSDLTNDSGFAVVNFVEESQYSGLTPVNWTLYIGREE